ncbi:BCCT family transporter [Halomonas organivorans]|uniref:BCCT family betaine/carnitine transporter n=1 Tax=Halomonas organivorans TaxID=257772 RepID=A0A7W5BV40_9GAMM|nr:BCCT family transporter [Halomonas organivorans]MBB3139702.1 BCCT family betaine/carnitine transporter [Halomonas organivorans]
MTHTTDHNILEDHIDQEKNGIPLPEGNTEIIDTDYVIGQDNISGKPFGIDLDLHGKVFTISSLVILSFVVLTLALNEQAVPLLMAMRDWVTGHFTWLFLLSGNVFVLVCLGLVLSPLGKVRIGGERAKADYSYAGWFAMLFAAGMGVGLVFFGVAEPMGHFDSSLAGVTIGDDGARTDWAPLGAAEGNQAKAIGLGMAATIYHWGLHPWAAYAIVALSLGIFAYNKGLPLSVRAIFYPLLKERVWGWPGHLIDILAVFSTLFGLATALGLGASQATAGMEYLFGVPNNDTTITLLISVITGIALLSVSAGLEKGVQRISKINMGLAFLLLGFVIVFGPTTFIASGLDDNLTSYLAYLPALAEPFGREDANFTQGWTAIYWCWWISWSPFVGMFIARVSRGRTVREFLIAVLLIPTLVSSLWMTSFGSTAIDQLITQNFQGVKDAAIELKLFVMLSEMPFTLITSTIGILLAIVFFVTSSDSGSLVIDSITAGGKLDAPRPQRIFWCIMVGAIAIALLVGGGLNGLQAAAVSTGLPFSVVLLVACYTIVKGLIAESRSCRLAEA